MKWGKPDYLGYLLAIIIVVAAFWALMTYGTCWCAVALFKSLSG